MVAEPRSRTWYLQGMNLKWYSVPLARNIDGSYSRTLPNEEVLGVQFQSHASAVDFTTFIKVKSSPWYVSTGYVLLPVLSPWVAHPRNGRHHL